MSWKEKIILETLSSFLAIQCQSCTSIYKRIKYYSPPGKNLYKQEPHTKNLGLVVMGGDSCPKGRGFESRHRILEGHFFTYICCKNCNGVCFKKTKNNWFKRLGLAHFFFIKRRVFFFFNLTPTLLLAFISLGVTSASFEPSPQHASQSNEEIASKHFTVKSQLCLFLLFSQVCSFVAKWILFEVKMCKNWIKIALKQRHIKQILVLLNKLTNTQSRFRHS